MQLSILGFKVVNVWWVFLKNKVVNDSELYLEDNTLNIKL